MKKLLLILLCLPFIGFGQNTELNKLTKKGFENYLDAREIYLKGKSNKSYDKKIKKAIKIYTEVIDEYPDYAEAYFLRGLCYANIMNLRIYNGVIDFGWGNNYNLLNDYNYVSYSKYKSEFYDDFKTAYELDPNFKNYYFVTFFGYQNREYKDSFKEEIDPFINYFLSYLSNDKLEKSETLVDFHLKTSAPLELRNLDCYSNVEKVWFLENDFFYSPTIDEFEKAEDYEKYKSEVDYVDGLMNGDYKIFRNDGSLFFKTKVRQLNKKHYPYCYGEFFYFHKNGKIKKQGFYEPNEKNNGSFEIFFLDKDFSKFESYHRDSQKELFNKEELINYRIDNKYRGYSIERMPDEYSVTIKGINFKTYDERNKRILDIHRINQRITETFYENGNLSSKISDDVTMSFYETGELLSVDSMGKIKEFYSSGELLSSIEDDRKSFFNKDGTVFKTIDDYSFVQEDDGATPLPKRPVYNYLRFYFYEDSKLKYEFLFGDFWKKKLLKYEVSRKGGRKLIKKFDFHSNDNPYWYPSQIRQLETMSALSYSDFMKHINKISNEDEDIIYSNANLEQSNFKLGDYTKLTKNNIEFQFKNPMYPFKQTDASLSLGGDDNLVVSFLASSPAALQIYSTPIPQQMQDEAKNFFNSEPTIKSFINQLMPPPINKLLEYRVVVVNGKKFIEFQSIGADVQKQINWITFYKNNMINILGSTLIKDFDETLPFIMDFSKSIYIN